MYADPRTRFAHPDMMLPRRRSTISDPLYSAQWHLNTTSYGWADIDAPQAWAVTAGSGATVAVYDDAVDVSHPDLADAVVWTWNYERDAADPAPTGAGENHGTAVAGVAVARANGIGVCGSAPQASLIAMHWGLSASEEIGRASCRERV